MQRRRQPDGGPADGVKGDVQPGLWALDLRHWECGESCLEDVGDPADGVPASRFEFGVGEQQDEPVVAAPERRCARGAVLALHERGTADDGPCASEHVLDVELWEYRAAVAVALSV